MRDLYDIFEESIFGVAGKKPRGYVDEDPDDTCISFSEALEIAERDNDDNSAYDEWNFLLIVTLKI